jgi:MoxR-like ATPase
MEKGISVINEKIKNESAFLQDLISEIRKVIVGQDYLIERLLIGLLADGHILVEGVPGLAKTLSISTLSQAIQTKFQRIQFTPDLLPADLIGTTIYRPQEGTFEPKKGPIFANLILADEINRAPAKVQSALLESMQERQVTISDSTFPLPVPFLVMATQNPIEQEGTYPLPEAQIDRFMLKLKITYPDKNEEKMILERMATGTRPIAKPVIQPERLLEARKLLHEIYVDEKIKDYIVDIVFATRNPADYQLEEITDLIDYGASPRASIYLILASKAHAFLKNRGYVIPDDVKAVAMDVLRHRVIITYEAEAEEIQSEEIVQHILDAIEVP